MEIDVDTRAMLQGIVDAPLPWLAWRICQSPPRAPGLLDRALADGLVTIWRRPEGAVVCLTPLGAEVMRVELEERSDPQGDEEFVHWINNPETGTRQSWMTRPIPSLPRPVILRSLPGTVRLGHPERLQDRHPDEWDVQRTPSGKVVTHHGQPVWARILKGKARKRKARKRKAG